MRERTFTGAIRIVERKLDHCSQLCVIAQPFLLLLGVGRLEIAVPTAAKFFTGPSSPPRPRLLNRIELLVEAMLVRLELSLKPVLVDTFR